MDYETYKELTLEQQEEFNFKFKDRRPILDFRTALHTLMFFMFVMVLYMCLFLLANSYPEFEQFKEPVTQLLTTFGNLGLTITLAVSITAILEVFSLISYTYRYSKWKKDNGIKERVFKWKKKY